MHLQDTGQEEEFSIYLEGLFKVLYKHHSCFKIRWGEGVLFSARWSTSPSFINETFPDNGLNEEIMLNTHHEICLGVYFQANI